MSRITPTTRTSSSLPRAYIGTRRNRHYISSSPTSSSSSLSNDYFSSITSQSKSFQTLESEQKNDLSNAKTADALQTQPEDRTPLEYFSDTTQRDERQLHLLQEKEQEKAKGFLSSTSSPSSSSLFLFPTRHNVTSSATNSHSPRFSLDEQQHFYHPSFHYEQQSSKQPLQIEDQNNNTYSLFDQQKYKQTSSSVSPYHHLDLSDVPEENTSFSTSYTLSDTNTENNDTITTNNNNNNQSFLLTSTPTLSSYYQTRNNYNNNSTRPLPLTYDSTDDQSSTISTTGLITDLQHKADVCQLNNMSTTSSSLLRHSSNLGAGLMTLHPYDQRISDQGTKYIIQLKTDEYQENDFTITPRYSLHQIVIDAKHREEDSTGGYVHRELHKIFNIPKHIDLQRHTFTYSKHNQELTIEMPYLQTNQTTSENQFPLNRTRLDSQNDSNNTSGIGTIAADSTLTRSSTTAGASTYESLVGKAKPFDFDLFHRSAFRPKIVQATSNDNTNSTCGKKLLMSLDLSDYQAEDIKVSVKDRELIVKAERKIETDTRKSRTSFYQSTSLPPQTDIDHLQSNYVDGKLVIEAPYIEQIHSDKKIHTPLTNNNNNQTTNW